MNDTGIGRAAEQSRATLEREVAFVTLTGERLPAAIKQLSVSREADSRVCLITWETEWSTYEQMIAGEWMGLLAAARGRERGVVFERGRRVELRAALKPGPLRAVLVGDADAEHVVRLLLRGSTETNMLLQSESWLVTEVKQLVTLPAELDSGVLKMGYRTMWADAVRVQPAGRTEEAAPSLNDVVERYLQRLELPFERMSDALVQIPYTDEQGGWTVLVLTVEEQQVCMVYSVCPMTVPEELRRDMALFLSAENYDLALGSFEMDPADGELRYRTSIDVGHDPLSEELFARIFSTNVAVMGRYLGVIAERLGG